MPNIVTIFIRRVFRRKPITRGVTLSVKKYGKTYTLLSKYDKGEVAATKYMADYRRLRKSLYNSNQPT